MAIEGPLRELGIHDVFQLLDLSRKTGLLCVSSKLREDEGVVHFDGGRVVHASIRSKSVPTELVLLEAGRITQADLDRARASIDDDGAAGKRTIVDSLVRLGAITQREVERHLRLQIESVVFELMSWREGFFSFEERARDDMPRDTRIAVSTESLLMEGARRIDEWSRIADMVPSLDVVPELAPMSEEHDGGTTLDLLPHEWQVLTMIDGERDLRAIAALLSRDEFETAKIAYGLATTGVVSIRKDVEPSVAAPARATSPTVAPTTGVAAQVSAARHAVEQLLRREPTGTVALEARDALDALARLERVLEVHANG
jgi:Domain of unknown function (DUF4388)